MTTKEKILDVSLTLFAEKGYSNVYVNDIAQVLTYSTKECKK